MKLLVKIISLIAILGFTSIGSSSNAFGDDGYQTNAQIKIKAKTLLGWDNNMFFEAERRDAWDTDSDHFYEHWEGIVGNVTPQEWFEYGVGYRYIHAGDKKHGTEHRPHVFVTPQTKLMGDRLKISARNKLEYRVRDFGNDGFQYKIKPKISYLIPATDEFNISPYVSDEIAYSMIKGDWHNNEVEAGLEFVVNSHYIITPFYKYISDIPSGDKKISMWGVNGGVSF